MVFAVAVAVTSWIYLYAFRFQATWKKGVMLVGTVSTVWGAALGSAVYLIFRDPMGAMILNIPASLEKVELQHVNEPALKEADMPDGQPVTKPLDGVDGQDEILITVGAELDETDDILMPATWEKTATPDEYLASQSRIKETYTDLTQEAQKAIVLRATFSSVVRQSIRRISEHIHGSLEKGEIPKGDEIREGLDETFEEHGMDYMGNGDDGDGLDDVTVDVGELDVEGMMQNVADGADVSEGSRDD